MRPCLAGETPATLSLLALFLDAPDEITLAGRVEYGAEGRMTDGYEGSPRGACTTLYLMCKRCGDTVRSWRMCKRT